MAMVVHEGALARKPALASSPQSTASIRLLVWVAAAALPWTAIAFVVRMMIVG
jgi:hypothetical protein